MLSIAINVKNGAKHIERCLDALVKFDDVVILDNHSTDATVQLASKYPNVRLFVHDFLGMGRVRNLLATYAAGHMELAACHSLLGGLSPTARPLVFPCVIQGVI